MNETLYDARGLDETRLRRVFGWVVTFRDFPAGSWQTVAGDEMMRDALTLFTKGRAEFFLDGVKRKDRVPGVLSIEHEQTWEGGTFTISYVEPTSRVCIPRNVKAHRGQLPNVSKIELQAGQSMHVPVGFRALVCLGEVKLGERSFAEEQHFEVVTGDARLEALKYSMLLDFTHAKRPT